MSGWPGFGHLDETSLARLFGSLATGKLTGILRLEEDGRPHALHWLAGDLVAADSSSPDDTMARIALESSLIDAAQVGECIRRMAKEPRKSQKQVLSDMGLLDSASLDRLARAALTRRSLRIFSLRNARFSVDEKEPSAPDGGPLEPRWVMYQGVRQYYDERRLMKETAELDGKALKLQSDDGALHERYGFSDEERIVIAYLSKGYWEPADLVDACMTLPRPTVLAVVLALLSGGELDVATATTVPRLRKRARESTVTLNRKDLPAALAQQISSQSTSVPAASPSPSPSPSPVRSATLPPLSTSKTLPPVRPSQTQQIAAVRSTGTVPVQSSGPASGSQPSIQHAPDANQAHAIHDKIMAKLAQVEANADHFTMLEVTRHAGSNEIKSAYLLLAKTYHPDRLALMKLEEMRPQVERIFARLSDSYSAIGEDAGRRDYLRVLEEGGEAAVKRREDDEVAHATRVLTAEEHFRKGEMALRRQMWPTALQEFQAALELNEAEPEHHALLAWAKWCSSDNKDAIFSEVRKAMNRAIELSDRCVPAFLYLGQIYSARGEHDRAYNMFQRVLGVNEHHVEANRQVRLIEMRRSKNEKKSGLFDMFKKK